MGINNMRAKSDNMWSLGFSFAYLLWLTTYYYLLAREKIQLETFFIHRIPGKGQHDMKIWLQ